MATAKLTWLILDMFGGSMWLAGILANTDNWKSLVLFLIGCVYAGLRVYFYLVQKKQAVREKDLELWHKEQDKAERIKRLT